MLRRLATSVLKASASASPSVGSVSGIRSFAAEAAGSQAVLVHMGGVDNGEVFSRVHKAICGTGGEIKESRSCRLGGRYSQMFLVAGADLAKVSAVLKPFNAEHLDVVLARQTSKDIKGPYCATSPLVPFVRKANLAVPWKRGIVGELTEFLNIHGVTVTDLDQYRAGKDVVLEGFAHLPTGLAEFPQVNEAELIKSLQAMGVTVSQFAKVSGQDPVVSPKMADSA